ncbi:MAG: hypothetical protein PHF67_02725 [Candidatus Nanoarchaeia archaeon]|nr:hypothetical protein [Candidatus Nanoarchaeia archaeon]
MTIIREIKVEGLGYVRCSYLLGTGVNIGEFFDDFNKGLISVRDEALARISSDQIGQENFMPHYTLDNIPFLPELREDQAYWHKEEDGTLTSASLFVSENNPPVLLKGGMNKKRAEKIGNAFYKAWKADSDDGYDLGVCYYTGNRENYETVRKVARKEESKSPPERTAILLPSSNEITISPDTNSEVYTFLFEDMADSYWKYFTETYPRCNIAFHPSFHYNKRKPFMELGLYFSGKCKHEESSSFKGTIKCNNARGIHFLSDSQDSIRREIKGNSKKSLELEREIKHVQERMRKINSRQQFLEQLLIK